MGKVREETEPKNVTFAGLYNFDAVAYESVLVGLYDIYRCKGGPRYGCPLEYEGHDLTGHSEFDSLCAPTLFLWEKQQSASLHNATRLSIHRTCLFATVIRMRGGCCIACSLAH